MRRDDYWNLFWATGMPEAWMLSRPTEGYLFSADPTTKVTARKSTLPEEAQQLKLKQAESVHDLTAE